MKKLSEICKENVKIIKKILSSEDILVFSFTMKDGTECAAVYADGITDKMLLGEQVARPLSSESRPKNAEEAAKLLQSPENKRETEPENIVSEILSGNTALFIDGIGEALIIGMKKISMRAIMEPPTSVAVKGPREGFIEDVKTNVSLIRNRLRTEKLQVKTFKVGKQSATTVCVVFVDGIANPDTAKEICDKIESINIDSIPDSSYIGKFLAKNPYSLFKQVGTTEKPDILCAKILEGRIAVFTDGSPIALTLPYLLTEDFQGPQDYFVSPYRATLSRLFRFFAVCVSVLLPAFYVAAQLFKLQLLPFGFLLTISGSIQDIPLSPSLELFFLLLMLEILIEASIRMPRYVALALSVIGALVLGDTAVKAGIVSSTAIIIMALSGISAYTVPDLVGTVSILRLSFLVVAGSIGTYGIPLLCALLLYYLISSDAYGSPMLAPFSPIVKRDMRDALLKAPMTDLTTRPEVFRPKNKTRLKPSTERKEADNG